MNKHKFYQKHGIITEEEFLGKYMKLSSRSHENNSELEGNVFWVSSLKSSNGIKIQRNQNPTEVVVKLDENGYPLFYPIDNLGNLKKKPIKFFDNANNGLHLSMTNTGSSYMYNLDLEEYIMSLNKEIELIEDKKEKAREMKLNINENIY